MLKPKKKLRSKDSLKAAHDLNQYVKIVSVSISCLYMYDQYAHMLRLLVLKRNHAFVLPSPIMTAKRGAK